MTTPILSPTVHRSHDGPALAAAVALAVAEALRQALALKLGATLVVSGGRTPVGMWQVLREQPLDWARVGITLADERWVPPEHPDSNEGLVHAHLLQGLAASAQWVPLYGGEPSPEAALPELEARLAALSWPADVVVLGMGADGHTASWFPGQVLPQGGGRCMAVAAPLRPNVALPRVSLTPQALLTATCLIVQVQGADKEATLTKALVPPAPAVVGEPEAFDEAALALPIRRALWAPGGPCQVFFGA